MIDTPVNSVGTIAYYYYLLRVISMIYDQYWAGNNPMKLFVPLHPFCCMERLKYRLPQI